MSTLDDFTTVKEIEYSRDFIDYNHQPLFKHKLQLYGIKNECCKEMSNICYTDNNEFLQCKECKRLFKWSRIKSKVNFIEEHKHAIPVFLSMFFAGLLLAYSSGWIR